MFQVKSATSMPRSAAYCITFRQKAIFSSIVIVFTVSRAQPESYIERPCNVASQSDPDFLFTSASATRG